ncbi:hypothetical protein PR048_012841, partial [Dryococelus australis]
MKSCRFFFLQNLKQEDKKEVEEITREQSDCHKWKEHRSKQLMASFFETIYKMKATTSCAKVVKQIHYNIFKGNKFFMYATENNISISHCGLVIEEEHQFLRASPDGLIGKDAALEVKCPNTANLVTPLEASPKAIICNIVERNDDFWREKIISKLSKFYFNCLLREIIDFRYARQLPIRDPDIIINAQKMLALKATKSKKNS